VSIPRALRPVGIALVDKPAGPSSFAIVAALRRRTRARTGHAGTLDPFATGLLLLLSGAATRLIPCFVGLDKRYVTDVDLTSTTTTGDPEGEVVERHPPPSRAGLDEALARLRGEIELPIPAASAVKIGGERAYRLARRGVEVEMPLRRSLVHALDVIAYSCDGAAAAEDAVSSVRIELHVGSGTYVRSIAQELGGHCTTLRRTAVGPFTIDEATQVEEAALLSVGAALERLPADAREQVSESVRAGVLALDSPVGDGSAA
jgi:tRNA pseudouridine55 synthase